MRTADRVRERGAERLGGEVRYREFLAGARVAVGKYCHNIARIDDAMRDAGLEREGNRRDIAAGNGDALGPTKSRALHTTRSDEFGKPIRPRSRVLSPVVRGPRGRVAETVVRAAVDDERLCWQLGRNLRGGAVRQSEDHDVVPCKGLRARVHEDALR